MASLSISAERVEHGYYHYPIRQMPLAAVYGVHTDAVPRHTHDFFEIVLVTGGGGTHARFAPGGAEATRYQVIENDVFVVPPGWAHGYERGGHLGIWNFVFEPDLIAREIDGSPDFQLLSHLLAGRTPPDAADLIFKLHLRLHEREAIEAAARTIAWELTTRLPGFEILAKAKLLEVLTLLLRVRANYSRNMSGPTAAAMMRPAERAVPEAIRFMDEHLAEPCRLEDVAKAARVSTHYFCELFKSETGLSAGKYLMHLRVERAKYLLLTTSLSVTEIALRSGFCDSSYFARVFKMCVGTPPRNFRKIGRLS